MARPCLQVGRSGMLIRGNLRDERSKVYAHVCDKVQELFGDKFCVLMLEDPLASEEDAAKGPGTLAAGGAPSQAVLLNTPRVAFQIVPAAQAVPPQVRCVRGCVGGWASGWVGVGGRTRQEGAGVHAHMCAPYRALLSQHSCAVAAAAASQTTGWGRAVAFLLAVLFVGSCGQLALAANVTKLPKETLEWCVPARGAQAQLARPGVRGWCRLGVALPLVC